MRSFPPLVPAASRPSSTASTSAVAGTHRGAAAAPPDGQQRIPQRAPSHGGGGSPRDPDGGFALSGRRLPPACRKNTRQRTRASTKTAAPDTTAGHQGAPLSSGAGLDTPMAASLYRGSTAYSCRGGGHGQLQNAVEGKPAATAPTRAAAPDTSAAPESIHSQILPAGVPSDTSSATVSRCRPTNR